MLISACPVNAVARMVDTSFYLSISKYRNGVVFMTDADVLDTKIVDAGILTLED